MNDSNDSYWKDFLRSGSVADYIRYAENARPYSVSDSSEKTENTERSV